MDEEKKIPEEKNLEEEAPKEEEKKTFPEVPVTKEEFLEMLKEDEPEVKEEVKEEIKPEPKIYVEISSIPEKRLPKPEGACLTMFRESVNERETGQLVYKGEDALPFVNDHVMLVADGLGGASSIRHVLFNRGLFEEEGVYDALFGDMYGEKNPLLEDYAIDSFGQLIAVRNLYDEKPLQPKNVKKGGYFASRIVSSIFLNQVFNAGKNGNTLYEEVLGYFGAAKVLAPSQKVALQESIGKKITDIIHEDLKKISEHANLIYESKYSGVALLGTTLTATILNEENPGEEKGFVDAFYFQAGDSRPYVLNKNGLKQIMRDHEGKDGGMTNYIRANDEIFERPFYIETKYERFEKPCILFNASDGCFDSNAFVSPLAFEKLILEAIRDAKDYEGVSEILRNFFLENGHHDDSSTIAMKFFGYNSFEEWQAFAKERLAVLEKEYFGKMNDLLEVDFGDKLELVKQQNQRAALMLAREFKMNEKVLENYREAALKDLRANFDISLEEVTRRLIELKTLVFQYMDQVSITMEEEGPRLGLFNSTENKEEAFAFLTADQITIGDLKPLVESDNALEDVKILKTIINTYFTYKGLEAELNDVKRALENAPKFLEEDFNKKGGFALLEEFIEKGIYSKEEADDLLIKVGVNNDDVSLLEQKKVEQDELFAKYDEGYEEYIGKEE